MKVAMSGVSSLRAGGVISEALPGIAFGPNAII